MVPSLATAELKAGDPLMPPAETLTMFERSAVFAGLRTFTAYFLSVLELSPRAPVALAPQAQTCPELSSAKVCAGPAETWMTPVSALYVVPTSFITCTGYDWVPVMAALSPSRPFTRLPQVQTDP